MHLQNLLTNDLVPTIIQSTAIEYLQYVNHPKAFELILASLINKEPLVRQSGYVAMLSYPANLRTEPGLKGLDDPIKAVRLMAFRTVVDMDVSLLNPQMTKMWNNVNAEYIIYLKGNADFPGGQTLIGEYYQQQSDYNRAVTAFERALKMDSIQVSPYTNLAILYSGKNHTDKVKSILLQGISNFPENPGFFYFMGLNEGALGNEVQQLNFGSAKSLSAKEVQDYISALKKGFSLISKRNILSNNDIITIQSVLEKNNAGFRKVPGTALKNATTGETVYTSPQDFETIQDLMTNLEQFINDDAMADLDPIVKMAIIHYQFEGIHPFYDGNG